MAGGRPKSINYAQQPGIKQTKANQWRWDIYSPRRAGGYEKTAELAYWAQQAAKKDAPKTEQDDGDLPLSIWADRCLQVHIIEPNYTGLRIQTLRTNVERHIKPAIGERPLREITPTLVATFIAGLARSDGGKEPLSPHTKANIRNDLSLLLRFAVPHVFPANPCAGISIDRHVKRRDADGNRVEHKRTLTPAERERLLLEAAKYADKYFQPWMYGFILIGLRTGLRKSELIALRWIHVDWDNKVLRIEDQLHQYGGKRVTRDTKSDASERVIPLSASVLEWLKANKDNDSPYVLADAKSRGPIPHRGFGDTFKAIAKRAKLMGNVDALGRKLADPTPHDMRHTFGAMHANELKTAITVLRDLMGHEDIRTTADYYVDAGLEDLRAAMKGVP